MTNYAKDLEEGLKVLIFLSIGFLLIVISLVLFFPGSNFPFHYRHEYLSLASFILGIASFIYSKHIAFRK